MSKKLCCMRNGVIHVVEWESPEVDGSLTLAIQPIADGEEAERLLGGVARLSSDNETWLVPGIPESSNDSEAYDALIRFERAAVSRLARMRVELKNVAIL